MDIYIPFYIPKLSINDVNLILYSRYGALMWSMGKVMKTPEVMRVFIGSFWDQVRLLMFSDNLLTNSLTLDLFLFIFVAINVQ